MELLSCKSCRSTVIPTAHSRRTLAFGNKGNFTEEHSGLDKAHEAIAPLVVLDPDVAITFGQKKEVPSCFRLTNDLILW